MSAGPAVHSDGYIEMIKAHGYKNILAVSDILSIHNETLDLLVKAGPTTVSPSTRCPTPLVLTNRTSSLCSTG